MVALSPAHKDMTAGVGAVLWPSYRAQKHLSVPPLNYIDTAIYPLKLLSATQLFTKEDLEEFNIYRSQLFQGISEEDISMVVRSGVLS